MKIYGTRYFEKLKVRPVNPNDFSKIWFKHMDPNNIKRKQDFLDMFEEYKINEL